MKNNAAFSLIEVLIALLIFSAAAVSLLRVQYYFLQYAEDDFYQTLVFQQIENIAALWRAQPPLAETEIRQVWQASVSTSLPNGQASLTVLPDLKQVQASITWENSRHVFQNIEFPLSR